MGRSADPPHREPLANERRVPHRPSVAGVASGLVLLAFGLRVFRLDVQSLWGDETISVFRAALSLAEITAEVPREGTLPPLYYYLLHVWIRLAGQTEMAVRLLSVMAGALAVPLLYALVRRTVSPRAGLLAGVIATFSPYWIYYAQETRTYALLTTLVMLALYLLIRAESDPAWEKAAWPWASYAVVAALALASHYFAGFALAAAVLWLLARCRQRPSLATRCLLAQAGAALLLSPLLMYVAPSLLVTAGSVQRGGVPLGSIVEHLAVTFNLGTSIEPSAATPFVVVAAALAGIGLVSQRGTRLWGLVLVLPILAVYAVSFNPYRGWARYFIMASPGWYALLAAGLDRLLAGRSLARSLDRTEGQTVRSSRSTWAMRGGRLLGVAAGLLLLAGAGLSLANYYFDPTYWRYDLRSGVRQVDTLTTPDVAVVVNGPRQFPSFFYYFRKTIPWVELPAPGAGARETVEALQRLASRYRGIWLVKYRPPEYDPDGLIEAWLGENAYKAGFRWIENTTFSLYLTEDPEDPQPVASFPVGIVFGDDAELVAYRASLATTQRDDYVLVHLRWRALRTPFGDLRVFAHLLDADGRRVAQSDHRPVDELRPSWTWQAGELLEDRFALRLPDDGRSGLRLVVGLYQAEGDRLPPRGVTTPDRGLELPLPGLSPVHVPHPLPRSIGGAIALLGYDVAPGPFQAGGTLSVTLFWKREGTIPRDYTVFVHLLDDHERLVAQQDSPPLGGRRPTTTWLQGEVLVDRYELQLPGGIPPGSYHIQVGMYDPSNGQRLDVCEAGEASRDPGTLGCPSPDHRVLLPTAVEIAP